MRKTLKHQNLISEVLLQVRLTILSVLMIHFPLVRPSTSQSVSQPVLFHFYEIIERTESNTMCQGRGMSWKRPCAAVLQIYDSEITVF